MLKNNTKRYSQKSCRDAKMRDYKVLKESKRRQEMRSE